jgi:hypothetical protein
MAAAGSGTIAVLAVVVAILVVVLVAVNLHLGSKSEGSSPPPTSLPLPPYSTQVVVPLGSVWTFDGSRIQGTSFEPPNALAWSLSGWFTPSETGGVEAFLLNQTGWTDWTDRAEGPSSWTCQSGEVADGNRGGLWLDIGGPSAYACSPSPLLTLPDQTWSLVVFDPSAEGTVGWTEVELTWCSALECSSSPS